MWSFEPVQGRDEEEFGNWFKKAAHAVSSVAHQADFTDKRTFIGKAASTTVGKIITAPLVAPTAFAVKGTTWLGRQTGISALKTLDSKVNRVYKGSAVTGLRNTYGMELAAGAAVGATILTGGGTAAIIASAMPAAFPLLTGAAAKATPIDMAGAAVMGVVAGQATHGAEDLVKNASGALGPGAAAQPAAAAEAVNPALSQAAGAPTSGGVVPLVAGAGTGFLLGGPIGAVVGAVAGAVMGKKGAEAPVAGFGLPPVLARANAMLDVMRRTSGMTPKPPTTTPTPKPADGTLCGSKSAPGTYKNGVCILLEQPVTLPPGGALTPDKPYWQTETPGIVPPSFTPPAVPVTTSAVPTGAAPATSSGSGALLAGAGAGFLVGGPVGAVIGGVLAAKLGKKG